MKIMFCSTIAINVLLILFLLICYVYSLKKITNPKLKANLGILLCGTMIIYLFSILLTCTYSIYTHNYKSLCLLFFVIIPFIIGKYATYKKIKRYTYIQFLFLILSLATLIILSL